jgi:hypothetical protein
MDVPTASTQRRERRQRGDVPAVAPAADQGIPHRAGPSVQVPVPALAAPPSVDDPSFAVLFRLWQELKPEGRGAAVRYMAELLGEI